MITNFNEFKQKMNESFVGCGGDPNPAQIEHSIKLMKCLDVAVKCGLSRDMTKTILEKVFTDPAKAPEEINVKFVIENLDKLKSSLDTYPVNFGIDFKFNPQILESKNPYELIMFIPTNSNSDLSKLNESLIANIKKDGFKVIYEIKDVYSIFYINNLNMLTEHNKKVVLSVLEKAGAINIATQLKWTRTLA